MHALYTFGANITHYKTESVNFLGLMNSATKMGCSGLQVLSSKIGLRASYVEAL